MKLSKYIFYTLILSIFAISNTIFSMEGNYLKIKRKKEEIMRKNISKQERQNEIVTVAMDEIKRKINAIKERRCPIYKHPIYNFECETDYTIEKFVKSKFGNRDVVEIHEDEIVEISDEFVAPVDRPFGGNVFLEIGNSPGMSINYAYDNPPNLQRYIDRRYTIDQLLDICIRLRLRKINIRTNHELFLIELIEHLQKENRPNLTLQHHIDSGLLGEQSQEKAREYMQENNSGDIIQLLIGGNQNILQKLTERDKKEIEKRQKQIRERNSNYSRVTKELANKQKKRKVKKKRSRIPAPPQLPKEPIITQNEEPENNDESTWLSPWMRRMMMFSTFFIFAYIFSNNYLRQDT